mgnify:CR=1 FL=1
MLNLLSIHIFIFLISLSLILTLFFIATKTGFFIEKRTDTVRKIHSFPVIKTGGLSFLPVYMILFLVNDELIRSIILFSLFFLLIGFLADIYKEFSSYFRFILMILVVILFIGSNNFIIYNIDDGPITELFLNYPLLSILFSLFGLMFTINGFNFIDGNNGLLLGVTLIILTNFLVYLGNNNYELSIFIISLLIVVSTLFVFNFFSGKILSGDTGSYFIGFVIGAISILIKNYGLLNSYLIACLISYPIFELVTSFFRRIMINKTNPFEPDNLHLHSMLFQILKNNYEEKISINKLNSITSLIIICYLAIISIIIYNFSYQIGYFYSFFILLALYLIFYIFIKRKLKNSF